MVYRSKRRKFNDFVSTHNWKYYLLFLIIFVTVVAIVVILAIKSNTHDSEEKPTFTTTTTTEDNTATPESDNDVKGKYRICLNIAKNIISIYDWNPTAEQFSSSPVQNMPAAFPAEMAEDEYSFKKQDLFKAIWHKENTNEYYRYYTNFGDLFTFHSAVYTEDSNKNSLDVDSYNCIGQSESPNGIILRCSDARWIYENCSYASEIVVLSDESASTDNISPVVSIPVGINWDPSDISEDSPFCPTRLKEFYCTIRFATLPVGVEAEPLLKYFKAIDENGNDVSAYIYCTQNDEFTSADVFDLPFYIADIYGNLMTAMVNVTIVEPEPETTVPETETTASESETTISEIKTTESETTVSEPETTESEPISEAETEEDEPSVLIE